MAKLNELKALVEAARARAPANAPKPGATASDAAGGSAAGHPSPAVHRTHATRASDRAAVRRHVSASKHSDCDVDISQAFADVTRLPPRNRAPSTKPRPAAIARQRLEDERDALEMSKYGVEPSPHSWDIGQELEAEQTFLRRGLGTDVLMKLRRGHWTVQSVLDLHGMTTDEAHDTLADFLLDARNQGLRCVRIIHGKGLTSPNREPVLKGKVRRWLSQWNDVLAYCEAARHAGGSGAVVVLLQGR